MNGFPFPDFKMPGTPLVLCTSFYVFRFSSCVLYVFRFSGCVSQPAPVDKNYDFSSGSYCSELIRSQLQEGSFIF